MLQLAVPYYEELTVRQNVFFAAHMRLPKRMSHSKKFERVEQILEEVSLIGLLQVNHVTRYNSAHSEVSTSTA